MNPANLAFSAVLLFSGAALFADISGIVPSYNVKLSDGVYSFDNSKTNYAALKWEAPVEAGKHYLLEFHVTSEKQAELMFDLRGFQDNACNLFNRYAVVPGSEQYRVYFYAPAAAKLSFKLFSRDSLKLSGLKFQAMSDAELQRIDTQSLASQFYYLRRENGAKVESVADRDSILGGRAVRYTLLAADGMPLTSRDIPLQPDRNYELSFWCKGPAGLQMHVRVDGWASGRKHWYLTREFKLENDEYQLYRIPFRTPDDVNRFLGRGRLILTLKTTQATIEIKGLTLVRKPAEK